MAVAETVINFMLILLVVLRSALARLPQGGKDDALSGLVLAMHRETFLGQLYSRSPKKYVRQFFCRDSQ
jgi:hypothetical protein